MKSSKLLILLTILSIQSCKTQTIKINGVSFVASREVVNETHIKPVVQVHANYAAVMPFGFMKNLDHPKISYNSDQQWFGETKAGVKQYIETLRKKGIEIMIKPQIWVWHGEFTGDIEMKSETHWKTLEDSYASYILDYAALAHEVQAELFCIGTELEAFITHRPEFWKTLIKNIKTKYKGKLTYAANWDEYKRTPFWNDLDYIGIDAYFPVSDSKTPTVQECLAGWETHKKVIYEVSQKYDRPILFTEYGYRSVDYSGKSPWVSDRRMNQVNHDAQMNTTQALFETFWKEDWFAGGFIWKWFINHEASGGLQNTMFTPQNKPVEALLRKQYKITHE